MLFKYKKCTNCQTKIEKSQALKTEKNLFCSKNCCEEYQQLLDELNKTGLDNCCG